MNDRELMQQAFNAMLNFPSDISDEMFESIKSIKARLAQPEHTTPRQWQGLTADEIWSCNVAPAGHHVESHICVAHQNVLDFAEAIEAKLKEKNT